MAQDGAGTDRKGGGDPSALPAHDRVTDGVHAPVHRMEAAAPDAVVNPAPSDPQGTQLPAGDNSLLTPAIAAICPSIGTDRIGAIPLGSSMVCTSGITQGCGASVALIRDERVARPCRSRHFGAAVGRRS
jgi:hypothetical protein